MSLQDFDSKKPKPRRSKGKVKDNLKKLIKKYNIPPKQLKKHFTPEEILNQLRETFGKQKFKVLWSGGKDSGSTAGVLDQLDALDELLTVDTGIATPDLFGFLKDESNRHGWKWKLLPPKYDYGDWVLKYGFPGPQAHSIVMGKLKYQVYRNHVNSLKDDKICLMSGVRRSESDRRNKKYPYHIDEDGKMMMARPIFYWKSLEPKQYCLKNDIKIAPAYNSLHISGDCMCGSFADPSEPMLLKVFYPKTFEYIKSLEVRIQTEGTKLAKKYSKWGSGVGISEAELQKTFDEYPIMEDACEDCSIHHENMKVENQKSSILDEIDSMDNKIKALGPSI